MKTLLSFIILYFISFIALAQTWTGQGPDNNWDTVANWNNGLVPNSTQDVIIPTGFTVTLNVSGSIKSIAIQGNSVLNMDANLTFTANSQIASNARLNWTNGILNGTGRTLENLGTVALSGSGNKFLGTGIRVHNKGLFTLEGTGNLFLNQSSELVNFTSGAIDLKSGGSITFNVNPIGQVLNNGLIKRTTATGIAIISVPVTNNDGIISVEMGTLNFQNANTVFNDGTYNVSAGATMNWNTPVNPSGTLTGTLDGDLNWNNTLNVPMGATVNLDFNATDKFNWKGTLRGGGTLANINVLNISGSHNSFVGSSSTLINLGTINFTGTSGLFLNESSTLNNPVGGVIDFQSDGGNVAFNVNPAGLFYNEGLIKKTTSSGAATILAPITNNDGIIQVESGILNIQSSDTNFIDGTYNVSTGAAMNWNTPVNPSGTLTGTLDGDLNWNNTLNVPMGATVNLDFDATDKFNWKGTLRGGGTLANINVLNISGNNNSFISNASRLYNLGTINFTGISGLFLNESSILNNPVGGVIDFQSDGGNVAVNVNPAGLFHNEGLIKKTTSSGPAFILAPITNNDGIIQVESGILNIQSSDTNFIDGTYNVSTGAAMNWNTPVNPSGTLTGTLDGDLNWNNTLNVPTGATVNLDFDATDKFNWKGTLRGGGTLANINVLNISGNNNSFISNASRLYNLGTINFTGISGLFLNESSTLDNPVGGVIDFQSDGGNVAVNVNPAGLFHNEGLIKKTTSSGAATILAPITNNDGIIQVESGILNIQSSNTNFINGTYNVFTGATMNWTTPVNPSGTLTGTLAGDLNWNNTVNVVAGTYAAVNFAATDHFNWLGTLSGGGTLTNVNAINFRVNNSFILNATTLENDGVLNFLSSGNLFLNQNSVLNNLANGIIDFKTDSNSLNYNAGTVGTINNSGLIKKSTGTGVSRISPSLNNSGIIDVQSGEIEHTGTGPFVNQVSGIVQGIGIFDLPTIANFTNNGTFAPGGSPGILTVQGDYKSATSSFIQLEINGQTAGIQHDALHIIGNNIILNGSLNVVLGYAPQINDEFIVITADSIAQCNLPTQVTTDFNGMQYTFSVICNPGNVTLKVTNITLGTADVVFANTKGFPNPTTGVFTIALNETVSEIQVTVTNMLGQTMMSERFNNTNMLQLDLQGSAGMYFVNLNDGQGNARTIRVMKH